MSTQLARWAKSGARPRRVRAFVDGTPDVLGLPLPAGQRVSPDIEKVLGHPAAPFAAWAERVLPAFR
ncbi:hypothetical protein [Streptomyces sp. NBC_01460]|uniref:hypothetical protein n=1 Tax=Streptomyces sp. NBC_01460 TaxID=2903875 RepID=UPI002E34FBCA|nr:hypothetical protein [Streptomyces sp. NBC_01460]